MSHDDNARETEPRAFITNVHGVRDQVADVARAVAFYRQHLGFTLEHQQLPAFANVSLGGAHFLLGGPGASGSRPMPDGRPQQPGGWNRVVWRVTNLPDLSAALKAAGVTFRNAIETGPAGRQVQIEDPDGNPIELFEPARRRCARRSRPCVDVTTGRRGDAVRRRRGSLHHASELQLRSRRTSTNVRTRDTRMDPTHPRRLEKNRNMLEAVQLSCR